MKNNNYDNPLLFSNKEKVNTNSDMRELSKSTLNTPLIFTKKVNDKYKVIPLSETRNTLGKSKFFPPATREWFNSVYAYNVNSLKNLPSADITLSKIIKSYFNLYMPRSMLRYKNSLKSKSLVKSNFMPLRYRRLSLKKIFVSKAELKHTTNKVIITLYVYNEERRLLNLKINDIMKELLPKRLNIKNNKNTVLKKKLFLINLKKLSILKNLEDELSKLETFKGESLKTSLYKDIALLDIKDDILKIAFYKVLLNLNRSKFEDNFLSRLKLLISKIYSKEVEFNIVNLKTLYLNSDIFTQAISMKIKNKKNKLLRVLKASLKMANVPIVNKMREKYRKDNKEQLWLNKVKNLKVDNIIKPDLVSSFTEVSAREVLDTRKVKQNNDLLSVLLLNIFPNSNPLLNSDSVKESNELNKEKETNENVILNSLKYKSMAGVRLEAKGRLTKRSTASRSVFKVKWKGSLKNLDSSYRGLSSVILRGHVKPNLQYSVINSKVRNGTFGLKGWIGNK